MSTAIISHTLQCSLEFDPIRVPRIRENYHRVPTIRENRISRIWEIGSLQVRTGYLTFSLKKTWLNLYCY